MAVQLITQMPNMIESKMFWKIFFFCLIYSGFFPYCTITLKKTNKQTTNSINPLVRITKVIIMDFTDTE